MSRLRVADDITQLVGETPMLQLKRLVPAGSAQVFAKLEYLNPGGSVKDRAAIGIIRRAEQEGKLKPDGTIVEATAGNTGIGLALIGVNRGYKVRLFVPERFSEEKVTIMRALGAEVFRTPDVEGMQGAIKQAKALVASDPSAFMAGRKSCQSRLSLPDHSARNLRADERKSRRRRARLRHLRNVLWNRALPEGEVARGAGLCGRNARFDAGGRAVRTAQGGRHRHEFHSQDI